jgi:hypothetical protein
MATTKTELYNNGTLVATKTSAPFNTFDWTPASGEVGSASLTVKRYEDGVLAATSAAVGGTVDAASGVEATALVNFIKAGDTQASSPWNNFTRTSTTGSDVLSDENAVTLGNLGINSGSFAYGSNIGYNGTAYGYPAEAWKNAGVTTGGAIVFNLTQLDNAKTYNLEFYSSRTGTSDGRTTAFTINGVKKTLQSHSGDGLGNTDSVVFNNIAPSSGTISFTFAIETGAAAYMNILKITRNF